MASCSFHRSLEALTHFLPYRLSRSSVLYFVLAVYPPNTLATLKSLRLLPRERVTSIHRTAGKAHSRKPISIHSHAYAVPGRMQASLFSELPKRVLLGNRTSDIPSFQNLTPALGIPGRPLGKKEGWA